jgi:hypothetical protein
VVADVVVAAGVAVVVGEVVGEAAGGVMGAGDDVVASGVAVAVVEGAIGKYTAVKPGIRSDCDVWEVGEGSSGLWVEVERLRTIEVESFGLIVGRCVV